MSEPLMYLALSKKATDALHDLVHIGWDTISNTGTPTEAIATHAAVFQVVSQARKNFPQVVVVADHPEVADA